jgi:hypothetical protein
MPAVRHVAIRNFRGFRDFETALPPHAVVVGEPGAGRSDLVEGLVRVLDGDYWKSRRGDELDFFRLDETQPAEITVVLGNLSASALATFALYLEIWDKVDGRLVPDLVPPATQDPARHEDVVRIRYSLVRRDDGRLDELVYWPKASTPERQIPVRAGDRDYLPFFWQRGVAGKPLDLAGRGELRGLVDAQQGDAFDTAIAAFMDGVRGAASTFSEHPRVKAALDELLLPLREVRRFDPGLAAEETIRFLPDGGAVSGLLRSLSAALTLSQGPSEFPVIRHGTTAAAALRAGVLVAAAAKSEGAIVAVDDMSGDLDPALARHLGGKLRAAAGQAILTTRDASLVDAFEPEEVVRLSWSGGERVVHRGHRPIDHADRVAQRYFGWQIAPALSSSAVVIVEGVHDRLVLDAAGRRLADEAVGPSFAAAGIEVIEANGAGEVPKVAAQAKSLGLYVVALFDNDNAAGAATPAHVTAAAREADVVLYLPPDVDLERILTDGVGDADLQTTLAELAALVPGLPLPAGWSGRTGRDLERIARRLLHGPSGSLHALFVRAVPHLGPEVPRLVARLHGLATARAETGIVAL